MSIFHLTSELFSFIISVHSFNSHTFLTARVSVPIIIKSPLSSEEVSYSVSVDSTTSFTFLDLLFASLSLAKHILLPRGSFLYSICMFYRTPGTLLACVLVHNSCMLCFWAISYGGRYFADALSFHHHYQIEVSFVVFPLLSLFLQHIN